MAYLALKQGIYLICFRYAGNSYKRSAADHPWRRAIWTPRRPATRPPRPPRPPCSASVATLPALRKEDGAGGRKRVIT